MSNNFKLVNNDLSVGRGMDRLEGVDYVIQLVKNRLLTFLTEWDLDETLGIDWYNIMGYNYDLSIIQGLVTQTILETEGVTSVVEVTLNLDSKSRILSISFTGIGDGKVFTEIKI